MAEAVPPGPIATLLRWLCSGGTQMAATASSLLTAILDRESAVGVTGRFSSSLASASILHIVLFTARLSRQMAACRAPGKRTDGLSSAQN